MTNVGTADPVAELRDRHLAYYRELALQAETELASDDRAAWIEAVGAELDNLRSALRWAVDGHRTTEGLELAAALLEYWESTGAWHEGKQWLEHLLAVDGTSTVARAKGCYALAELRAVLGDYEESIRRAEEAVELFAAERDDDGAARALTRKAWSQWYAGRVSEAAPLFGQAIEQLRRTGDAESLELALRGLGWVELSRGNGEGALALHEEGLAILRRHGDRRLIAYHLGAHGNIVAHLGDHERRRQMLEESLELLRAVGHQVDVVAEAMWLASDYVNTEHGVERAEELYAEALRDARSMDDPGVLCDALAGLGSVAIRRGDRTLARTLFREAIDQSHRQTDPTNFALDARASLYQSVAVLDLIEGRRDDARRLLDDARVLVQVVSAGPAYGRRFRALADLVEACDQRRAPALRDDAARILSAFEDTRWEVIARLSEVDQLRARGETAAAIDLATAVVDLARGKTLMNDRRDACFSLGSLLYDAGRVVEARSLLEESADASSYLGQEMAAREILAAAAIDSGDVQAADRALERIAIGWHVIRIPSTLCRLIETLAKSAAAHERYAEAARLLGAAEAYRQLVGASRTTHDVTTFAACVERVRERLGEREFTAAFDDGARVGGLAILDETMRTR
jgi:tetratricopeptide (TPR) repeat protein